MSVIYVQGARLAGGGIGDVACQAARGLARHGLLQRLLVGSSATADFPAGRVRALGLPSRALRRLAVYDRSGRLPYLDSVFFDAWAARQLEPAGLLHAWSTYGLRTIARARAEGMVTVLERSSTHPRHQAGLLAEEYARWALRFRVPQPVVARAVAEVEAADWVLVPSRFVRDTFVAEGFPPERLVELPYGVDATRFAPAPQLGDHPFRVLFVGQVGLRKGVHYLLQAWQRLGWRDAELWLVGAGDGRPRSILQRWAHLPGVRLLAYMPDPLAAYQQADVFAFPSLEEGSALVTYEALACGLPVVTTPNAGSVLRSSVEGFIVPARDVESLAARLDQLRRDENLRRSMGQAARQRAFEFSWGRYGDRLAELYRGLLARRGRAKQ